MDDWRRNRGEYSNRQNFQSGSKSFGRSQYRKPQQQFPPDFCKPDIPSWVSNVPSWERKFITNVCRMPWGRFVHCQKGLELYDDIFQWDDSAGGEAFHNSKSRFWAQMNGLYCDISLPDPDMYVDEIDWNARTDPELYMDLEKVSMLPVEEGKDVKAGFAGDPVCQKDEPIVPSGWDDEEPYVQGGDNKTSNKVNSWAQNDNWKGLGWGSTNLSSLMKPIIPSGCDVGEDDPSKTAKSSCHPSLQDKNTSKKNNDPWEGNCGGWEATKNNDPWEGNCRGWEGNKNNDPWEGNCRGWEGNKNNDPWEGNCGGWEGIQWGASTGMNNTPNESENLNFYRNSGNWSRGNENWRKREGDGQHMSRYKTTRYHQSDDYQADHGWRNNRGKKRVSFAHEHSPMEPLAPRQWNSLHTCGPVNQHRPGEAGNSWGWEKQVSYHIN